MELIIIFAIISLFVIVYTKSQDNQNNYINQKKDAKNKEQKIEKEYIIENTNQKALEKIYNTEYSIVDIYLRPFNDNKSFKVLLLSNDKPIGDIPEKYTNEISSLRFVTGQIYVESNIDNEGNQIFKGITIFQHKI